MKKNIIICSMALASLAICPSCTNLESEMYNVIGTDMFPKNEADAESLVTSAAYSPFRSNWYEGLFSSGQNGIHVITEMTTDIGYCQWNNIVWADLMGVNFTSNSASPTVIYKNYISDISKMTITIDRISSVPMDEELRKQLIAELRCARGWLAYILYDLYGPVQVASLEMLKNPFLDDVAPRLSHEDMVTFIEEDLNAAKILPPTYKTSDVNYGRFTRGLVYTVLMKLYMHENNWSKAVECGRELMKPEYGYGLMDTYKDIFTLENEGNKEVIWSCVCSRSVNQQLWLAHVLSSQYPTKNKSIQKWGGYRVMWDFYHTFDSKDERLEVLVGNFKGTDGIQYNEDNPGSVLAYGAMPIKYGEDPDATGEESQVDWIVYRYADILTLLAEAIVRDGKIVTQEAVDLLNDVHTRAGLEPYQLTDFLNVDDFLNKVLEERGHELWFEGVRRTDLIRFGKYIEYAKKYRKSSTAQDYMTLMPLPQSVIDESKGKIAQNPGY